MMRAGNIPVPKPKLKIVSDWKPVIWDAVYRLEAYQDGTLNRMRPGFVIAHSCGLSLVRPCEWLALGAALALLPNTSGSWYYCDFSGRPRCE